LCNSQPSVADDIAISLPDPLSVTTATDVTPYVTPDTQASIGFVGILTRCVETCASQTRGGSIRVWLAPDDDQYTNQRHRVDEPTTILTIQRDGQQITARASGQIALDLRALPRGATICATLHAAPPHDPQIIAFTIFPA